MPITCPSESGIKRVIQPRIYGKQVYFNAYPFYQHLYNYTTVDIICYTFHCSMLTPRFPLGKVIANKIVGKFDRQVDYRLVSNVHTKMYLCYDKKKLLKVFIGSWNFSPPSYLECISEVMKHEMGNCALYFIQLWNIQEVIST